MRDLSADSEGCLKNLGLSLYQTFSVLSLMVVSCFHNRVMNTAGVETLPGIAWRRLWQCWMELNTVSN